MKVFFTGMEWFPECQVGGLDRYFYEEIQAFAAEGIEGNALLSWCEPTRIASIAVSAMAPRGAPLLDRWKGVSRQANEILAHGVDAVNTHFALYAFPWVHRIPKGVPLIVNFQGPWAEEMVIQSKGWKARLRSIVARRIERKVYRRADRVITLSNAFRDLIHRDYGVALSAIRVVPGASHLASYLAAPPRQEARARLGWPSDRPILLSVRRLARRMGLELLIDAIAFAKRDFPNLLLFIGGKGPEAESLRMRIQRQGVQENVRLQGFISEENLPLAYAAADCTVVPTAALEGFGLISVESLASGTPVLGTRVCATPEILEPFSPQTLFDDVSAEAMADKIRLVLSREIVLPGPTECRRYALRYGWPAVVPRLMEVYHEAIEECKNR